MPNMYEARQLSNANMTPVLEGECKREQREALDVAEARTIPCIPKVANSS